VDHKYLQLTHIRNDDAKFQRRFVLHNVDSDSKMNSFENKMIHFIIIFDEISNVI